MLSRPENCCGLRSEVLEVSGACCWPLVLLETFALLTRLNGIATMPWLGCRKRLNDKPVRQVEDMIHVDEFLCTEDKHSLPSLWCGKMKGVINL